MIYVNDFDKDAAHWLSRLPFNFDSIDQRSIKDVRACDVIGFKQCHFFAGIGGWPLALAMAGWPSEREVWTGSCPCQPFSAAGKRKGTKDERHLWPEFRRLIDECRPATIFGEQVASKDGRNWLAAVRADMEAMGYAFGAADLCAAGVGAPHIRQRLFWVSNSNLQRCNQGRSRISTQEHDGLIGDCTSCGIPDCKSCDGQREWIVRTRYEVNEFADRGHRIDGGLPNCGSSRLEEREEQSAWQERKAIERNCDAWADVEYIPFRDGKARPIKPGIRLLANGVPGRVAQLRGLGNAIVPQVAAEFIAAFLDTQTDGVDDA